LIRFYLLLSHSQQWNHFSFSWFFCFSLIISACLSITIHLLFFVGNEIRFVVSFVVGTLFRVSLLSPISVDIPLVAASHRKQFKLYLYYKQTHWPTNVKSQTRLHFLSIWSEWVKMMTLLNCFWWNSIFSLSHSILIMLISYETVRHQLSASKGTSVSVPSQTGSRHYHINLQIVGNLIAGNARIVVDLPLQCHSDGLSQIW
jgi:hypothetical protein